jgi:hypothetical protein
MELSEKARARYSMLPESLQLKSPKPDPSLRMHQVGVRQEMVDRVLARRDRYHWFDRLDPQWTALLVTVNLAVVQTKIDRPAS